MPFRVRIKVCGLTLPDNARAVAELGVDEIGLNFFEPSTRYVDPVAARDIARTLPPEVRRVGVFVNASGAEIDRIAELVGLDRVQLHGEPSRDFCLARTRPVVRAFRSAPELTLEELQEFRDLPVLLDGFHPGLHGGTGRLADWELAARIAAAGFELYLAGGLGPDNLSEAIARVSPSVVDLNSGVESAPGVKDLGKVQAAIAVIRGAVMERDR
ncbi:MAG TPA: phosphoribosylanthranilate isomerase [Candidatus Eisenbacteria bacterium]